MTLTPIKVYSLLSVRSLYSIYHLTFGKNYSFPGESHDFWEMTYVRNGSCGCTMGDKLYEVHEGDILLNRPNVFHGVWTNGSETAELFTLTFDGTGLDGDDMPAGKFRATQKEINSFNCILDEIPGIFEGYDLNEFAALNSTASPDDVGYQIIKSHIELICLSLKRRGKDAHGEPTKDIRALRYADIVSFLRENLEKNLTVQEICDGMYESPSSLKSIFRQFTGGGIMKYYNYMRCEQCMRLIKQDVSMKEIAEKMNFSSQFYFTYFFKRETGYTPTEFRDLNKS